MCEGELVPMYSGAPPGRACSSGSSASSERAAEIAPLLSRVIGEIAKLLTNAGDAETLCGAETARLAATTQCV